MGGCDGVVGTGGGGGPGGFLVVLFRGGAWGVGVHADVDPRVCAYGLRLGVGRGFAAAAVVGHALHVGCHRGPVGGRGRCWWTLERSVGLGCGLWEVVGRGASRFGRGHYNSAWSDKQMLISFSPLNFPALNFSIDFYLPNISASIPVPHGHSPPKTPTAQGRRRSSARPQHSPPSVRVRPWSVRGIGRQSPAPHTTTAALCHKGPPLPCARPILHKGNEGGLAPQTWSHGGSHVAALLPNVMHKRPSPITC